VSSISRDTCKTSAETTTSINRDGFVMVQPKAFCRAAAELAQAGAQPDASTGDPTMDALAVRGPGLPPPPPGTQYSPTIYGAPVGARTASDSTVAWIRRTACQSFQLQSENGWVAAGPAPIEFTRQRVVTFVRSLTAACSTVELLRSIEF